MKWSEEEVLKLKEEYKNKSYYELSLEMNRSPRQVERKIRNLKLYKTQEQKRQSISRAMIRHFETGNNWSRSKKYEDYSRNKSITRLYFIDLLGNKCVNCEEDDKDVLDFDHINNDGYLQRRGGGSVYYYLRKSVDDFQLLCANCNRKKRVIHLELIRLEKLQIPPF